MIDLAVKLTTTLFRNNMKPGAGDQFYPYGAFAQYPPGWIYPYMLNDQGNLDHIPSASATNAESLPESFPQFIENSSTPSSSSASWRPTSSAESKKAQDRWSKKGEKLLVQALTAWRGVLLTAYTLKCGCSFPDKYFVTGRSQVGFVLDKSEIAL